MTQPPGSSRGAGVDVSRCPRVPLRAWPCAGRWRSSLQKRGAAWPHRAAAASARGGAFHTGSSGARGGVAGKVGTAKTRGGHSAAAAPMCSGRFLSSELVATRGRALSA